MPSDWLTATQELIAFLGASFALGASWMQGSEALRKAKEALITRNNGDAERAGKGFEELSKRRFPLIFLDWCEAHELKDAVTVTERDVKHYVLVSGAWWLIVVGAICALFAGALQLFHDVFLPMVS